MGVFAVVSILVTYFISCLCKLCCSVLQKRLLKFSDEHSLIPERQIVFRPGSRTADHVFALRTLVDSSQCVEGRIFRVFC